MPHAALKLLPGVDQNKTPTLNEAAISDCDLVRFVPDRSGLGLVQKLGGWTKFYPSPTSTTTRALWAWEDTNAAQYLAAGNETDPVTQQASLNVIRNGVLRDITPRSLTTNPAVLFDTTAGDSTVTVTDTLSGTIDDYDTVFIATPVSIGGLILSGFYPATADSGTTYTIQARDLLGNLLPAPSTDSGGTIPAFASTINSALVTVTLAGHGLSAGGTFAILVPLVFDGLTLYGNYTVFSVPTADTFTIQASTTATAGATADLNNGNACLTYYFGVGPLPPGSGFGRGGFGRGGFGRGASSGAHSGTPIPADDWTIDNWGQVLIACPVVSPAMTLTTTAAAGTGATVTLTLAESVTIPVGTPVTVAGVAPTGYNGFYYVTASSAGSVSYAGATTGAQTVAGTVTFIRPASSPIFQWDPTSGSPTASVISYGPPVNDGVFVAMPQRQIVAWGSSFTGIQDPLLNRWCDLEDYSSPGSWIAQPTNQAGSFRIPKGSRIVSDIQGPQQGINWTDLAVWSMQYISQPFIYSFNEIATGCGLISRKAAGSFNGVVYWMGQSQFFQYTREGVVPLLCPVWDVIFQQLDTAHLSKIRVAVNSRFNEVAWYYPTLTSNGEVAAYVKYNTLLQQWDFGALGRSAWVNESVLGPPIGADPVSRYIYQHETSTDADGQPMNSYFQTGYFVIAEADLKVFIDQVWPDAKWGYYDGVQSATLNLTFFVADYSGQTPAQFGPYPLVKSTTFISPRFRGRLVSVFLGSSDLGSFWRIGDMRYRFAPDGKF